MAAGCITYTDDLITINELLHVDYMAQAVMILMWGKDIMRAIGRGGP